MKTVRVPLRGGLLYKVTLLPNRNRFLAYCRSRTANDGSSASARGDLAWTMIFLEERWENDAVFGEMIFYEDYFTVKAIAHEATHLAIEFHKRAEQLDDSKERDEWIACTVGEDTEAVLDWREHLDSLPAHTVLVFDD